MRVSLRPPRVLFGHGLRHRVHHALLGFAFGAVGAALVASDWDDRRVWIRDLRGR